jgi:hypothetical protein
MLKKWLIKRMKKQKVESPSMAQFVFSLCFFSAICCGMGYELTREAEWLIRHTIMAYPIRDVIRVILWSVILMPPTLFVGTLCWINHKYWNQ